MFILGAIVVDVSLVQLRARELEAVAGSAANDALAGLDIVALRAGHGIVVDPIEARRHAEASVAAGPLPTARVDDVVVSIDSAGRTVISVTTILEVDLVMAPAVGSLGEITIRRTESATILGSELI